MLQVNAIELHTLLREVEDSAKVFLSVKGMAKELGHTEGAVLEKGDVLAAMKGKAKKEAAKVTQNVRDKLLAHMQEQMEQLATDHDEDTKYLRVQVEKLKQDKLVLTLKTNILKDKAKQFMDENTTLKAEASTLTKRLAELEKANEKMNKEMKGNKLKNKLAEKLSVDMRENMGKRV